MKRIILALVILTSANATHAAQNYNVGNLLLGIGLGAGTASVSPLGGPQMTIHPSVEIIVGTWSPNNVGIALGITLDSSVNLFGTPSLTGTLAPMATMHITIAPKFDWYVSLGMGLQMLPANGTSGLYNIHVGFATGFNVVLAPAWILNFGLAIHADQFFGSAGVKIRFGDAKKIQYRR